MLCLTLEFLVCIVTEQDILSHIAAEHKDPFKITIKEIISLPLIAIDEKSIVADAILLMSSKCMRRMAAFPNTTSYLVF